jgi:hypothetical protein
MAEDVGYLIVMNHESLMIENPTMDKAKTGGTNKK